MNIEKAFLASVCYAADNVVPKLESATSRWLAYGAIAAYRPRLNALLQNYSGTLTEIALFDESGLNLERLKEIGSFAFSKEPIIEFEVPVLGVKLKIGKEDFDKWVEYLELSAQNAEK